MAGQGLMLRTRASKRNNNEGHHNTSRIIVKLKIFVLFCKLFVMSMFQIALDPCFCGKILNLGRLVMQRMLDIVICMSEMIRK